MNVQVEISLYPLRTDDLGNAIEAFLRDVRAADLTVQPGNMSSTLSGDVNAVFSTMGEAFAAAAEEGQVVLVMKVSNACPAGQAPSGPGDTQQERNA